MCRTRCLLIKLMRRDRCPQVSLMDLLRCEADCALHLLRVVVRHRGAAALRHLRAGRLAENPRLMQLVTFPLRRVFLRDRAGSAHELRLAVCPILLRSDPILVGATPVAAIAGVARCGRHLHWSAAAEEVAVVRVALPHQLALALLRPCRSVGLPLVAAHVLGLMVEDRGALLPVRPLIVGHVLRCCRHARGLRVVEPLEVVRREPQAAVVHLLQIDPRSIAVEDCGGDLRRGELHLSPDIGIGRQRLTILCLEVPGWGGWLWCVAPRIRGAGQHVRVESAEHLVPRSDFVFLGNEGLRHSLQLLLVVAAKEL
mmetsp:Transcript_8535/g.18205  ORF Transcript_8535/g.18205 Transcript_8535/m.18205 type:complete len:313 (+) Transcript_8535:548-1486(+)